MPFMKNVFKYGSMNMMNVPCVEEIGYHLSYFMYTNKSVQDMAVGVGEPIRYSNGMVGSLGVIL